LLTSVGLCCVFSFCLIAASSADRPPSFTVTTTPATETTGPLVKIEGTLGFTYTAYPVVADNTTFDLSGAYWSSRDDHPNSTAFVAGNQPVPPKNIRMIGGVVHGNIPTQWSWILTHAFGGSAFHTVSTGLQALEGARIHNVQDGWRPRETPEFLPRAYANTGRFVMRDCYATGIRDDCIENDEFIPGAVEDCLFDGAFTFFSEQNEKINGIRYLDAPTIGPDEDPNIEITRVLVRLAVTSGGETGPGTWFKLHGYDAPNHHIVITDSVFAVRAKPRAGWKHLNFPKNSTFKGTNHFLWLGEPGTCDAKIPEGLTFVEGRAARDKWIEMRNKWLVAHGYDPRGPDDWNPMEAPIAAPKQPEPR
jgi:hypothetical protein